MMRLLAPLATLAMLTACTSAGDAARRLAPRAAESIDPRAPVEAKAVPVGAASAVVTSEVARQVALARGTAQAFAAAENVAAKAVGAAGPAQSESWIQAQMALSALEETHGPAARAAAALDALLADEIQSKGGIAPGDRTAIEAGQAEVNAIDRAQAERLRSLASRL